MYRDLLRDCGGQKATGPAVCTWSPRKAIGAIQYQSEGPRPRGANGVSPVPGQKMG